MLLKKMIIDGNPYTILDYELLALSFTSMPTHTSKNDAHDIENNPDPQ